MLKFSNDSFSNRDSLSNSVLPAVNVEFSFISMDWLFLLESVDARSVITLQICASSCVSSDDSDGKGDDDDDDAIVRLFFSGCAILLKFISQET